MTELITVVAILLFFSFTCSMLEAVLLSMSRPFIQTLVDKGKKAGLMLKAMKDNIDEPIAAILTLNTIAHTIGAAVSGAMAAEMFGSRWMGAFSAVLTFLILLLSEIIPKTIGARYWKSLSPMCAYVLRFLVLILKPVVVPMNWVSRFFSGSHRSEEVTKAEIYNYIKIGYRQGAVEKAEFHIIENLLSLRRLRVREIMTPRVVVETLDPDLSIKDIRSSAETLRFSRIPLYDRHTNEIKGLVLRRELIELIGSSRNEVKLRSVSTEPLYLPETMSVLKLIGWFSKNGAQMGFVLNEYGDYSGIVTIEDAVETLLGIEIVDEYDPAVDMRAVAKKAKKTTQRRRNERGKK